MVVLQASKQVVAEALADPHADETVPGGVELPRLDGAPGRGAGQLALAEDELEVVANLIEQPCHVVLPEAVGVASGIQPARRRPRSVKLDR